MNAHSVLLCLILAACGGGPPGGGGGAPKWEQTVQKVGDSNVEMAIWSGGAQKGTIKLKTIILLHGAGYGGGTCLLPFLRKGSDKTEMADLGYFRDLVRRLGEAQMFNIVKVDLPGTRCAPVADSDTSVDFESQLASVREVVAFVKTKTAAPIILVGHSIGGQLVTTLYAQDKTPYFGAAALEFHPDVEPPLLDIGLQRQLFSETKCIKYSSYPVQGTTTLREVLMFGQGPFIDLELVYADQFMEECVPPKLFRDGLFQLQRDVTNYNNIGDTCQTTAGGKRCTFYNQLANGDALYSPLKLRKQWGGVWSDKFDGTHAIELNSKPAREAAQNGLINWINSL